MLKPQDFRQTGYFVIDDKRCNIQELTCEQIRIHFGTGRSILVSGTGRDKKYTYRSGCMTDIGDILDADWFALARFIIERDGEQDLYNGLVEYVNGCAWLRSKSEREEYALDLHMGNKKSAVIIAALNEYLASHPELQSPCCKIEVKVGSNLNQSKMEQIIRTIVEEKMAMLQISGTATPKSEQVPEALEQDVATMLDNLDLFG